MAPPEHTSINRPTTRLSTPEGWKAKLACSCLTSSGRFTHIVVAEKSSATCISKIAAQCCISRLNAFEWGRLSLTHCFSVISKNIIIIHRFQKKLDYFWATLRIVWVKSRRLWCNCALQSYRIPWNNAKLRPLHHFKVRIHGHQFWYQCKTRMRLPVYD